MNFKHVKGISMFSLEGNEESTETLPIRENRQAFEQFSENSKLSLFYPCIIVCSTPARGDLHRSLSANIPTESS